MTPLDLPMDDPPVVTRSPADGTRLDAIRVAHNRAVDTLDMLDSVPIANTRHARAVLMEQRLGVLERLLAEVGAAVRA